MKRKLFLLASSSASAGPRLEIGKINRQIGERGGNVHHQSLSLF